MITHNSLRKLKQSCQGEKSMAIKSTTDTEFSTSLRKSGVTLVDFTAHWCGPCKALTPILEQLECEFSPALTILKVDVEKSPGVAGEFGIRAMPTIILFKDTEPKEIFVGLKSKEIYKASISELMEKVPSNN
jgi:thioredoxin 1